MMALAIASGQSPELNGSHRFSRFNPAAGATFRFTPALVAYANVSQSSRAPTAVELACAEEDAPCSLPNAFLADPLSPTYEARRVARQLMSEVPLAAEILVIRILDPTLDNLFVVDGSVLPTSLGVNPQETIFGIARWAATHIGQSV